ncbi:ribosomal protein S18-alanine N-acetyltransferase [Chloroflexota bacterium]
MNIFLHADTLIVRPMRQDDLEQVEAIDRVSFSMPWPKKAFLYELNDNPRSTLWVAEANTPGRKNQVVGVIVSWLIMDEVHIATLAIHPNHRGKGIAQRLILVALREAVKKGAHQATLEVRANNIPAQELYHRFGFNVVGRRVRYYRDNNEDALIMTATELEQILKEQLANSVLSN